MSFHNNPRVVTDNLIVSLDAVGNKSFPSKDLPVKGSNLVAWFDATDDATFSYGSGSNVARWDDKSGNEHHLYQDVVASSPVRSGSFNSQPIVVFDGTNDFLRTSSSIDLTSSSTMFVVVRSYTSVSDAGVISINDSLSSGITIHNGNLAYFYFGSGGQAVSISVATSETNILTKVWNGETSGDRVAYKNGTKSTVNGVMSDTNASGPLRVGLQSSYLNGLIGEILIYDKNLSDDDINKVHTYLQNKWTIPSPGVTSDGTTWYDLSGNGYNGTLTNSPTYNNSGYFDFDGSDDYVSTSFGSGRNVYSNPISFVAWVKSDTTTNNKMWLDHGSNGTNQRLYSGLITADNAAAFGIQGSPWSLPSNADTSKWYHQAIVMDSGTARAYYDGIAAGTKSYTSYTLPGNTIVGGRSTYYWDGKIARFAIYNKALTAAEVLQNYNALKSRFGL